MSATKNKIEVVARLLVSAQDHVAHDKFHEALGNIELSMKLLEDIRRDVFWSSRHSGEGPK